ncbi:hypothetical protein K461DRAFT_273526 [Myriangium duriaei CBS 260.36]|uniref:Uncharacterized protein n=1 Tax=Myriangium duriaei CBS 260.36 TaxID=1168546 RepID=A0A9P4JE67_9PEZI|nr:hypothetical protein K461DRAFT_273526 [Myriangium duriaei CBS 260.36]
MPRRIVYGLGLWVFLAGGALTIASLSLPLWLSHTTSTSSISYGLHSRCTTVDDGPRTCLPFPSPDECHGGNRAFCSLWRTVGFLMNFAIVLELATLVSFVVALVGGRDKREGGWKMCAGLCGVVALVQIVAMAIVAFVNDHDARFAVGWGLDTSTVLCTVSWVVLGLNSAGMVGAAYILPPEDDYEPIP